MIGILVTDGASNHAPEKWAEATADQIVQILESAPETRVAEARDFRGKLIDILTGHHAKVQQHERGQIDEHGSARLGHALEPAQHVEDPVSEIVEAASGYSFADHFRAPQTQEYLRNVLSSHFGTSMHIERSLHADANPDAPEAREFRQIHHPAEG